ncbi:hypothetical protein BD626DRAFT_579558, partial [Schizophyllum amplum]
MHVADGQSLLANALVVAWMGETGAAPTRTRSSPWSPLHHALSRERPYIPEIARTSPEIARTSRRTSVHHRRTSVHLPKTRVHLAKTRARLPITVKAVEMLSIVKAATIGKASISSRRRPSATAGGPALRARSATAGYAPAGAQDTRPPTDRPVLALTPEHQNVALYIHLLSLFLDTPSPSAPFSVHRMALAGRALGKDVGQCLGRVRRRGDQNTVHAYPDAGLGVAVASDGVEKAYASQPHSPHATMKSRRQPVRGDRVMFAARPPRNTDTRLVVLRTRADVVHPAAAFSAARRPPRVVAQLSPSTSSYLLGTSFTGASVMSGGSGRGTAKRRERRDDTRRDYVMIRHRKRRGGGRGTSLGIAGGRPVARTTSSARKRGTVLPRSASRTPTVPLREVGETPPPTQAVSSSNDTLSFQDTLAQSTTKEGLTRSATTADKKRSKKEKRLSFDTDAEKSEAGKASKHKRRHSQHLATALANASAASMAQEAAPAAPLPPPFIPREPVAVPLPPHSTAPTLPPGLAAHYLAGYTAAETRTFHCER